MGLDATVNPPQTVELRHTLPDGSSHVDWMLDLAGTEDGLLTTFRLERRLDDLEPGATLTATRIADHRRVYLTYEGEVSGERGRVERVAAGRIEAVQCIGELWGLLIRWCPEATPGHFQRLCLHRRPDESWLVRVVGQAGSSAP